MDASVYTRPNKPSRMAVRKRDREYAVSTIEIPDLLAVDRSSECHVTPASESRRMVDYLDVREGMSVLEPECGTGNLLARLVSLDIRLDVTAVEKHYSLISSAKQRLSDSGIHFFHRCFLEYAEEEKARFDRIIMNPPFRQTRHHVDAALGLLKSGGLLVALVPVTYQHPDAVVLEGLGNDVFPTAKVLTKIIELSG